MKRLIFPGIALFLVLLFSWLPTPEVEKSPESLDGDPLSSLNGSFVITDVRLYDGYDMMENVQVVVRDNTIDFIGEKLRRVTDLPVISARGMTLLPGLIDAHTHNWGDASTEALNFGVATELDMFTAPASAQPHFVIRDALSNTQQADLFSATILATAPQGHGTQFGIQIPVLTEVSQVPEFVQDRITDGADYIKAVYYSKDAPRKYFPSISLEILEALALEAHNHDKKLLVHIDDLVSAKEAIRAGADGLIHAFMDSRVDDELISLMRSNNVFITPTFSVLATVAKQGSGQALLETPEIRQHLSSAQVESLKSRFPDIGITDKGYQNAEYSIKQLHEAGVTVLAGSDAPNPGTTHGASLHEELVRLVQAGLSPESAIHAATGAVRNVLPIIGDRGTLKTGGKATMVLVRGNPFEDITDTQKIVAIWKHGQQLERFNINAEQVSTNPVIETGIVADFDNGISPPDSPVVITSDALMSGNSTAELSQGSYGDNGYLDYVGEIKQGYMFPWSGISIMMGDNPGQPVDMSQLTTINFKAKVLSGKATLHLLMIQDGSRQPATIAVELNDQWTDYSIAFSDLPGINLTKIVNLSLVFMRDIGNYNLQIDEISFE